MCVIYSHVILWTCIYFNSGYASVDYSQHYDKVILDCIAYNTAGVAVLRVLCCHNSSLWGFSSRALLKPVHCQSRVHVAGNDGANLEFVHHVETCIEAHRSS